MNTAELIVLSCASAQEIGPTVERLCKEAQRIVDIVKRDCWGEWDSPHVPVGVFLPLLDGMPRSQWERTLTGIATADQATLAAEALRLWESPEQVASRAAEAEYARKASVKAEDWRRAQAAVEDRIRREHSAELDGFLGR